MTKKDALDLLEKQIDDGCARVLSHPAFLRSISILVNMNSYRRKFARRAMQTLVASFELPVRTDQERMLALLEKLNARIEDLENRGPQTRFEEDVFPPMTKKFDVVGARHAGS